MVASDLEQHNPHQQKTKVGPPWCLHLCRLHTMVVNQCNFCSFIHAKIEPSIGYYTDHTGDPPSVKCKEAFLPSKKYSIRFIINPAYNLLSRAGASETTQGAKEDNHGPLYAWLMEPTNVSFNYPLPLEWTIHDGALPLHKCQLLHEQYLCIVLLCPLALSVDPSPCQEDR